jgi:hypothetical protein
VTRYHLGIPAAHRPAAHRAPPAGRRRGGRRPLLVALLTAGLLVATAGVAEAGTRTAAHSHSHTLSVTARDFDYRLSTTTLAAGLATTRLVNRGSQPHQAQIGKFRPGVGLADFKAMLKAGHPDQVIGLFSGFYGGPNAVLPGHAQTTYENLAAGHYLLLCFVPDPKTGMPHFAMGMYAPFTVVGSARTGSLRTEQAVSSVDPFRFSIPASLHSGDVVRFDNHSKMDVHEFSIGRLHPGKTVQDVITWAKKGGPPPYDEMGGAGAVNPGGREWFTVNVRPGSYVAFCLVPDDETGLPHAAMGMVAAFRVVRDVY